MKLLNLRHAHGVRLFAAAAGLALAIARPAGAATAEELEAKLQALATQVQALQSEVNALKAQNAALSPPSGASQVAAAAGTSGAPSTDQAAPGTYSSSVAFTGESAKNLDWFGYGEINYTRPTEDSSGAQADVARFVLGAAYRFNDRTRFVSELEVEHAIASSDDAGEVEVEQAWIEQRLSDSVYAKLGLFLIPSGMLNESHEPTRYYGVFRNAVETAIIPSTWRELGVGIEGNTTNGLRWDAGLTTGSDLSKWDATSTEGIDSPLGAIHQEGQLARAGDLSAYVAANYTGLLGLRLGASVFGGDISQGQPGFHDNRLLLWETHARWTPGAWDLSALYAHGHISNTAQTNLSLIGNPVLIPEDFYGWYAQAAYVATFANDWTVAPFARFERVNTGSGYAFLGAGLTPAALPAEEIRTVGFNVGFAPGVMVKIDYQSFDRDSGNDRVDLGLGYQF
jgi:hypothetical protein